MAAVRVASIRAEPFLLPLIEPFRISRASVDSTRAVLVRAFVEHAGARISGLGEAALPLGSQETVEELVASVVDAGARLEGAELDDLQALTATLDAAGCSTNTARAGLCSALADCLARAHDKPLFRLLGGEAPVDLVCDITLPIADPVHLAGLAQGYRARGFESFKVKVGADLSSDLATLERLAQVVPHAKLRLDANMGLDGASAAKLVEGARALGLEVECFEQPCDLLDFEGMRVTRSVGVPVVADESVRDEADLLRLIEERAIDGINLKLVKMGGVDRCLALGRLAKQHGLSLMVGAMIESRLGLTAMAHVAVALGGVEWVDLDTAFLLRTDPWQGGMSATGAVLRVGEAPGLGMTLG